MIKDFKDGLKKEGAQEKTIEAYNIINSTDGNDMQKIISKRIKSELLKENINDSYIRELILKYKQYK